MIKATVSEARENLSDLLGKVQHGGEDIEITRHGKPVAYVVSAAEWAFLQDCEDLYWVQELAKMRAEPGYDENDTVPMEEVFAKMRLDDAAE